MICELTSLVIAFIWIRWRGHLPGLILIYYLAYMTMENYPDLQIIKAAGWLEYYVRQSALDLLVIAGCCYLSIFYHQTRWLCLCYAVVVGTSQAMQLLMIIDSSLFAHAHAARQILSVPLDLTFAVLGSGLGVHLLRFANRFLTAYNQLYPDSNNGSANK